MHIYCTFTQICFIMHLHQLNLLYYVLMILIVHACLMHLTCRLHPCMLATCVLHGCYMHATFNMHLHAYIITLCIYNKHACTCYVKFMLHTLHLEQGSYPMLVLVGHILCLFILFHHPSIPTIILFVNSLLLWNTSTLPYTILKIKQSGSFHLILCRFCDFLL